MTLTGIRLDHLKESFSPETWHMYRGWDFLPGTEPHGFDYLDEYLSAGARRTASPPRTPLSS